MVKTLYSILHRSLDLTQKNVQKNVQKKHSIQLLNNNYNVLTKK